MSRSKEDDVASFTRMLNRVGCKLQKVKGGKKVWEEVDEEAIEWCFDYEGARPFLRWLSDNVRPANFLYQEQLEEYEKLVEEEKVLKGAALREALLSVGNEETDAERSATELRQEIADLEAELAPLEDRLERMTCQRDKLSTVNNRLGLGKSEMRAKIAETEAAFADSIQQCQTVDAKELERSVNHLKSSLTQLLELHSSAISSANLSASHVASRQGRDDSKAPAFLSAADFTGFFHQNEQFTTELREFVASRVQHDGPVLEDVNNLERYKYLQVSQPDLLLLHGESQETIERYTTELRRMQRMYPQSELQGIDAEIDVIRLETRLQNLQKHTELTDQYEALEDVALKKRSRDVRRELKTIDKRIAELRESRLPKLLHEIALLKGSRVLHGDYDLKLARQQYVCDQQDTLVRLLGWQVSCLQLMLNALDCEAQRHMYVHKLCTECINKCHSISGGVNARRAVYKHVDAVLEGVVGDQSKERNAVDATDTFLHTVYELLGDLSGLSRSDSKSGAAKDARKTSEDIYISVADIEKRCQSTISAITRLEDELASLTSRREQTIRPALTTVYNRAHGLVYGNASDTSSAHQQGASNAASDGEVSTAILPPCGDPQLSPAELASALQQLETTSSELASAMEEVIADRAQKQELLQRNPQESEVERKLYVYHFTDQEKETQAIEEKLQRVEARRI